MNKAFLSGRSVISRLLISVLLLSFSWVYPIHSAAGIIFFQPNDVLVTPVIAPDSDATPVKFNPDTRYFSAPLCLPPAQFNHSLADSTWRLPLPYELGRIPPSIAYPGPFPPRSPPIDHSSDI
ncbi:MAG: hypothetical protein GX751_08385 [Desulfuromonadaceae bacterium]|nr:hypothetical protein [Desulfuromonadaceae bacterium]